MEPHKKSVEGLLAMIWISTRIMHDLLRENLWTKGIKAPGK